MHDAADLNDVALRTDDFFFYFLGLKDTPIRNDRVVVGPQKGIRFTVVPSLSRRNLLVSCLIDAQITATIDK